MFIKNNLIQTIIYSFFFGELVGVDSLANRYYQKNIFSPKKNNKHKRWVVFGEGNNNTEIMPEWFNWLHYCEEESIPHSKAVINNMLIGNLSSKDILDKEYKAWSPDNIINKTIK